VTPAKRGKGNTTNVSDEPPTPTEHRASMTGFCSCKTGIHAIHGNNLDTAPEARIQYRPLSHIPVLRGIRESLHIISRLARNAVAKSRLLPVSKIQW
jgi:hypothetical protein